MSLPFRSLPITRKLVNDAQITDPLRNSLSKPPIDVVIAIASKDFVTAPLAIQGVLRNCANPVNKIFAVVEDSSLDDARKLLPEIFLLSENMALPQVIRDAVKSNHPRGREGWILQQVLGMYLASSSPAAGVLVLDSDTVLTDRVTFLDGSGTQLLQLSKEYNRQYEIHSRQMWGARRRFRGLSFVTHYQLMQPEILRKMFPDSDSFVKWVSLGRTDHQSPIADYHSYGRFLSDKFPRRVRLGRWLNKPVKWTDSVGNEPTLDGLMRIYSKYSSVSFHSYLRS